MWLRRQTAWARMKQACVARLLLSAAVVSFHRCQGLEWLLMCVIQVAARVGKGNYGQMRDSESTAELSAHQQQVEIFAFQIVSIRIRPSLQ